MKDEDIEIIDLGEEVIYTKKEVLNHDIIYYYCKYHRAT